MYIISYSLLLKTDNKLVQSCMLELRLNFVNKTDSFKITWHFLIHSVLVKWINCLAKFWFQSWNGKLIPVNYKLSMHALPKALLQCCVELYGNNAVFAVCCSRAHAWCSLHISPLLFCIWSTWIASTFIGTSYSVLCGGALCLPFSFKAPFVMTLVTFEYLSIIGAFIMMANLVTSLYKLC